MENVTVRKNKIVGSPNLSFISTHSDYLSRSLPDLSTGNLINDEVDELKQEIINLKLELQAAHNEIDNLILENNNLKKISLANQEIITTYKIICSEPASNKKCVTSKKKQLYRKMISESKHNASCSDLGLVLDVDKGEIEVAATKPVSKNLTSGTCNTITASAKECSNLSPIDGVHSTLDHSNESSNISLIGDVPSTIDHTQIIKNRNNIPLNKNTKPKILIAGGQQLTGLASALISSRRETCYQEYDILSVTKPYAPSEEILQSCKYIEDAPGNYVILCIGEHECNPYRLITNLSKTLQSFQKTNFVVINVTKNKCLNEKMLNNLIHNICYNFSNCIFLNIPKYFQYNKKVCLSEYCKRINYILDMQYYKEHFLSNNKIKGFLKSQQNDKKYINKARKGTIPYYFPIVKKCNIDNVSKNSNNLFFL